MPEDTAGRWTILGRAEVSSALVGLSRADLWQCRCACGTVRNVAGQSLRNGTSQSCGCLNRERSRERNVTHGLSAIPEYKVWVAMKSRCENPKNPRYDDYGGRGIGVCDPWSESFEAFIEHLGRRPSASHSINRVDNDQGYFPGNVEWSLSSEQMTNRRNTCFVETPSGPVALATLAHKSGIPANTLRARILMGWPLERALTAPVRPKKTPKEK